MEDGTGLRYQDASSGNGIRLPGELTALLNRSTRSLLCMEMDSEIILVSYGIIIMPARIMPMMSMGDYGA